MKDPRDDESRTFKAGIGGDGKEYGVTRSIGKKEKKLIRKKPCRTCPWRKDAQRGRFPADAFRSSASTAYDGSLTTFSCHESGAEKPATCAGFILANSENNMAVRILMMKGDLSPDSVANPEDLELYDSYREMAIANGVDPEDPRLAPCRSDNEDGITVINRMKRSGYTQEQSSEEAIKIMRDDDHDDLMKRKP